MDQKSREYSSSLFSSTDYPRVTSNSTRVKSVKTTRYNCHLAPDKNKTAKGSQSGGVGFLWATSADFKLIGPINGTFEIRYLAGVIATSAGPISVVYCYGDCEDAKSSTESLWKVVSWCMAQGRPCVIIGDQNVEAQIVADFLFPLTSRADVLNFGQTCFTSTGSSSIDFAVISNCILSHGTVLANTMQTSLVTHRPLDLRIAYKASEDLGLFMKTNCKPSPGAVFGPSFVAETEAVIILAQARAVASRYNICPGVSAFGGNRSEELRQHIQVLWENWLLCAAKEIQSNCGGTEVPCAPYRPSYTTLSAWEHENRP